MSNIVETTDEEAAFKADAEWFKRTLAPERKDKFDQAAKRLGGDSY